MVAESIMRGETPSNNRMDRSRSGENRIFSLTYTLIQGARVTRRATIWRRTAEGWKIVYHQGTVVEENGSQ